MDKLRQTIKQEKCYKELTIGRGLKICDPSCLMVKDCAAQKCFLFITFFELFLLTSIVLREY